MRPLARALLVMNVLYCVLAAAQEGLPGWHMFESVEPLDHELRDRDGHIIDVRAWLPRGANVVDRGELRKVVAFVCEKERAQRGPFTYAERGAAPLEITLGAEGTGPRGCMIHAPR